MLERTRKSRSLALIGTTVLHVCLFWHSTSVIQPPPPKSSGGNAKTDNIVFLEPIHPLAYSVYQQPVREGHQELSSQRKDCPKSFVGLGIRTDRNSGRVTEVAPGGPADKAGIQLEDRFVSAELLEKQFTNADIGTVRSYFLVRGPRETESVQVHIRIDKVCYEEAPSQPIEMTRATK